MGSEKRDADGPVAVDTLVKKSNLTFEWSSLSAPLLRSFLFFDYDDTRHGSNLGKAEIGEMTLDEVVERVETYDRLVDLSNNGRRSWAHDLLEALQDEENDGAFGTSLEDQRVLSQLSANFREKRGKSPQPQPRALQEPARQRPQWTKKPVSDDEIAETLAQDKKKEERKRKKRRGEGTSAQGEGDDDRRTEVDDQIKALEKEKFALVVARREAEEALKVVREAREGKEKSSRSRSKRSRSPKGSKGSQSRGRDRHRRRSRSSSRSSSGGASIPSSESSRSSSRSSSSSSSSSSGSSRDSSSSSSRSRSRSRARRARAKKHRARRSSSGRKESKKRAKKSGKKDSKKDSKKLSKSEASRKIRMSSEYRFKKLWAKCHDSSLAEANNLPGFFASVTSQLRMEASAGDKKTADKLEDLTDWIENVREETIVSFKRQVKPIAASRDMVVLAEEQLCLHMRGAIEEKNFLREVDWRKLSMRGISKVVAPLVKDESKRLVQSRGQQSRGGWGGHGQGWHGGGESWGAGRGGGKGQGKGAGRGMSPHMAWSKDGSRVITCHKCGMPGHYANDCPLNGGAGGDRQADGQKKAPATGSSVTQH